MARLVKKTAHAPYILEKEDMVKHICMCGLSKNQPFCDGSHMKTIDEKEGKTYMYDEKGSRKEVCDCGSDACDCGCTGCSGK